jgi:hypothetical protein
VTLRTNYFDGGATATANLVTAADMNALAAAANSAIQWNGSAGTLPATSGQHLTTQGGNTLDDGTGKVAIIGGTLDGVTIGTTTAAPLINVTSVKNPSGGTPLTTTQKPWLNQVGFFYGTLTSSGAANYLGFTDEVVAGNNALFALDVEQSVVTPATGLRQAIKGHVNVISVDTSQTLGQGQYIGIGGRAETSTNLGGTDLSATGSRGSFWGSWSFGVLNSGATNQANVFGAEVDITVASGASVREKKGILIALSATDSVRGSNDDIALNIANQGTVTNTWKNGIMFGDNQVAGTATPYGGTWPFASDSTIIGVSTPGSAGNPANIGIDFSTVTFTDCAIKTGPAPIQMGAMASAPATPSSGKGKIYVASDGSLHFIGSSGTDTRLALA